MLACGRRANRAAGGMNETETDGRTPSTPPLRRRFAYGVGSVAFGVKDAGFNYFLLIFYSQVVGLDPRLVGAALTTALLLDAVSDPVVGWWSDNTRSRWGRRHPFMYASALPTALAFWLLWSPPEGLGEGALFLWLLVLAVATRTAITFFETPSLALAPELTGDYVGRSTLLAWRSFFGWAGGNAMTVLMFLVVSPAFATVDIPNGQFNPDAYRVYGLTAAALIFGAILMSAIGTQGAVAGTSGPAAAVRRGIGEVLAGVGAVASNRSFLSLFAVAVVAAVAAGLSSALSVYFSTYFWGFTPQQIGVITLAIFLSALAGAGLAGPVTRVFGKKRGAVVVAALSAVGSPILILLRANGVLEGGGEPLTFWLVFWMGQFDVALVVCLQTLIVSMMADVSEEVELASGQRSEGVLFSASTFVAKLVTGIGVMSAALVLTLARFPTGADPSGVPAEALVRLGVIYAPLIIVLRVAMIGALSLYRIDRSGHEANLRRLAEARSKG